MWHPIDQPAARTGALTVSAAQGVPAAPSGLQLASGALEFLDILRRRADVVDVHLCVIPDGRVHGTVELDDGLLCEAWAPAAEHVTLQLVLLAGRRDPDGTANGPVPRVRGPR